MIELKNVCKTYKSKESDDTTALNDVSCKFANTGLIFITGTSGSGKSTLLNCLGGLDTIDSGDILINGINISAMSEKELDSYRNSYIGFVFQDYNILESLNVYENISLALELQNNKDDGRVLELLKKMGLEGLEKRKINELSGGQKQRVAIARALIKNPALILADEPTGNLDSTSSKQIMEILKTISDERTVIVVSHDIELAREYGSRIIEIDDGKIVRDESITLAETQSSPVSFNKSILSNKNAIKMSLGIIKSKRGRFVFTIILTAFALTFVALSLNVYIFDSTSLSINTMNLNDEYFLDFYKSDCTSLDGNVSCNTILLDEENIDEIENIAKIETNGVYSLLDDGEPLNFTFGPHEEDYNNYYNSNRPAYVEVVDDTLVEDIVGNKPTKFGEIVLTKRVAEMIVRHGVISSDGNLYKPSSLKELITSKKELKLGQNEVIVVGYIDEDDSMYETIKETGHLNADLYNFFSQYSYQYDYVYAKDFIDNVELDNDENDLLNYVYLTYANSRYLSQKNSIIDGEVEYYTKGGIMSTSDLELEQIVLSLNDFRLLYTNFDAEFDEYQKNNSSLSYDEAINNFLIDTLKNTQLLDTPIVASSNRMSHLENISFEIIGITLDENTYLSKKINGYYSGYDRALIGARVYNTDKNALRNIFDEFKLTDEQNEVGKFYTVDFKFADDVIWISRLYDTIHKYVAIITGVFILFAILLIYNFIVTTINYSKKNIGILRALGTTNKDIVKIFGFESLMIGLASWVLGIMCWIGTSNILNNSLNDGMFYMEYIVKEPMVVLYIFLFTMTLSILLTFTSISRISKIKPIDAILNK